MLIVVQRNIEPIASHAKDFDVSIGLKDKSKVALLIHIKVYDA